MGAVESQFKEVVRTHDRPNLMEDEEHHILCYGDNLTFGFCSNGHQCKPYAAALSDAFVRAGIRCKVSVGGLSGHTARQMAAAVDTPSVTDAQKQVTGRGLRCILKEDGPFDLCIIMAGTNDLTLMSKSEEVVKDLRSLHSAAHSLRVPTVALAPPSPQRAAQAEVAKLLANWVQTAQPVLSFANAEDFASRSIKGFWEPDNVHLSPAGSAALGQKLMVHLLPVISYLEWGEAATKAAVELAIFHQRQSAMRQASSHAGA